MDTVKLCPLCMEEIVEEGRGGYGRCNDPLHDWVLYVEFALLSNSSHGKIPTHLTRMETITPKGRREH